MSEREALQRILELAYAGHPDGREVRLEMIRRFAEDALAAEQTCAWSVDSYGDGIWTTSCKQTFTFIDDGPAENKFHYCYHCGKRLVVEALSDADEDLSSRHE